VSCVCASLGDPAIVTLGDEGTAPFSTVHQRREPFDSISVVQCPTCGLAWLRGVDDSLHDVEVLRRLSAEELAAIANKDDWPPDLDTYDVMQLCREAGVRTVWRDPERGSLPAGSMPLASMTALWVMADIARQRPNTTVTALAEVLGLDRPTAAIIAEQAVQEKGVSIRLRK